jgi:hypothetical protein
MDEYDTATQARMLVWLASLGISMPCDNATDGLAKAIIQMQAIREALDQLPQAKHDEWLEVKNNHVTVCVNIVPPGHIERCEVTLGTGIYEDLAKA